MFPLVCAPGKATVTDSACEYGSETEMPLARKFSCLRATLCRLMLVLALRDFAAWIGIVPRQDSTGGKHKLGPISKQGDQYLRRILVVGAHAVLKRARHQPEKYPWVTRLLERKPFRVVAVAPASKTARIARRCWPRAAPKRAPAFTAAAYPLSSVCFVSANFRCWASTSGSWPTAVRPRVRIFDSSLGA
jgi:hypothetical protein